MLFEGGEVVVADQPTLTCCLNTFCHFCSRRAPWPAAVAGVRSRSCSAENVHRGDECYGG